MYLAFAMERAHPATSVADLLDDELEVILGKVATELRSPKQLMALSALSRRFRRLVRQPAVWRELDVSQHRAYMTDSLLLRQIVRNDGAFSLLRRVDFSVRRPPLGQRAHPLRSFHTYPSHSLHSRVRSPRASVQRKSSPPQICRRLCL